MVFQFIGLIIAAAGIIISAIFWAFLNTCAGPLPTDLDPVSDLLPAECACGAAADLTGCKLHYYMDNECSHCIKYCLEILLVYMHDCS